VKKKNTPKERFGQSWFSEIYTVLGKMAFEVGLNGVLGFGQIGKPTKCSFKMCNL
jgi:hypothetical protein